MTDVHVTPEVAAFARWVAARFQVLPLRDLGGLPTLKLRSAADQARRDALAVLGQVAGMPARRLEPIETLAASSPDDKGLPAEMRTARGFRVLLSYEEEPMYGTASLCVLVQAPPQLAARIAGSRVYLWHGSDRHEIGELDADGKAMGVLPVGLQISPADLVAGRVMLEEPDTPDQAT
jgi:hypothetical protein